MGRDLKLKGKRAVIAGGSVGIGLAVAQALAKAHGMRSPGLSAGMSKPSDLEEAARRIAAAFDGIEIMINNAGTGTAETIMEAPDSKWPPRRAGGDQDSAAVRRKGDL